MTADPAGGRLAAALDEATRELLDARLRLMGEFSGDIGRDAQRVLDGVNTTRAAAALAPLTLPDHLQPDVEDKGAREGT